MLFASIDIGTNAVRLFFANVYEKNAIPVSEKASLIRIPLRLGEDVFKDGRISEIRVEKLIKTMQAFRLLLDVYAPQDYIACATAAMREASNGKEIVDRIRNEAGINIEIIDGIEEAKIVCAADNMQVSSRYKFTMYVDVGGGSTEISLLKDHTLIDSNSFKIGTIRLLTEKVQDKEWDRLKSWLKNYKSDFGKLFCIGSGGNINKLAKLYSTQIDDSISYSDLQQAAEHLSSFSLQERIETMGLRPDRADVIVPATKVFLFIMKISDTRFIHVPKIGLTDGLIHTVYKRYVKDSTAKLIFV
jgi:exopolyphosphatase / guanosine-5'-triphosphate,3'-diphosphate pyrophosphatase